MKTPPDLRVEHQARRLAIFRQGHALPLLVQTAAADKRPYIHPILAPDGNGELTENEPGHHLWQHGLYIGLNSINGHGFWTEGLNNDPLDGTFHPKPLAPPTVKGNRASWRVETDYREAGGKPLLTEMQNWSLEDQVTTLALDVEWTLRAETDLEFGQYAYGGLFLRMPWRHETHGDLLTSEGATRDQNAEGQRARWIAIAMPIPGRVTGPAGFAYFDHPSNPEFPNPWRVDGNLGIVPSRCIAGSWRLASGKSASNRYRLLAFTGAIDAAFIENQWQQFAVA